MPRVTEIRTTFSSGELDPTLRGQKDIQAYHQGARQCRNVQRRSSGGMERRPGLLDIGDGIGAAARLEAFEFSSTQRYVIAFRAGDVLIFDPDGALLQTIGGAPWDAATMWEMGTSQLGDVMTITHEAFRTKILQRTGLTTFTLINFVFDVAADGFHVFQPYYKFEDPAITLTPSGSTGVITLTSKDASGTPVNYWDAALVGQRLRIYDAEVLVDSLASSSVANCTVQRELKGKLDLDPFKTRKNSTEIETLHLFHGIPDGSTVTFQGANSVGSIPASYFNGGQVVHPIDEHHYSFTLTGVAYNYWEDDNGDGTPTSNAWAAARLSEDGGGPNVEFVVSGMPTRSWLEPSFSSLRGYPGACCFHEGRLWFAGSPSQPDGCWGSNALQFFRFDAGKGYDADSVQVATGTEDVSQTRHLISNGALIVMDALGESAFIVRDGEAITPNNARIKRRSNVGSSRVQPCVFDGAVVFTQDNGLAAYELVFDSQEQAFVADPISTLASHLIRGPASIAATPGTTARSESFCFFVNADGTCAVFHSMRKENVAGWVLWELGLGRFISVCTLGPDIFFCVARDEVNYRLYKVSSDPLVSLDGARILEGAASQDWVLDPLFRGRTVDVVSNLGYHGRIAVPVSGLIHLDVPVTRVVAGDGYYPIVETLPPSAQMPSGPRDGMIKRVVRSITDFGDDSLAVLVDGQPIITLDDGEDWAGALGPVPSPYEMHHLGCERDPTIVFTQSAPVAPWRILSVLMEVQL